ncbi:MAG TPA: hypothetical protein VN689_12135 [Burkholderiales bacterium]|nr:hypothetical protein [Burkholderiales bacterium]
MTDAEWWQDFWNGISAIATAAATGVALYFGIRASRREAADKDAKRQQIARAANILLKDAVDAVDVLLAKIRSGPIPSFPAAEVAFAKEKIDELPAKLRRFDAEWVELPPEKFNALLLIERGLMEINGRLAEAYNKATVSGHTEALPALKRERDAIVSAGSKMSINLSELRA